MPLKQSQVELIKSKLRSFSERYDRKIKDNEDTLRSMTEEECGESLVVGKIAARKPDDMAFKALFAEELQSRD